MDAFLTEALSSQHNKKDFSCGIGALDRYLQQQAGQEARRYIAATFVLNGDTTRSIAGYYTLSSTSVDVSELPRELTMKLPKYPILPATRLARLALDKKYHGRKLGELLLIDAMKRSLQSSCEIGSMAILVDAKHEKTIGFYQRYGFIPFSQTANKLFLPMATIKKLWISEPVQNLQSLYAAIPFAIEDARSKY